MPEKCIRFFGWCYYVDRVRHECKKLAAHKGDHECECGITAPLLLKRELFVG